MTRTGDLAGLLAGLLVAPLAAACSPDAPAAPRFELRAVVAPRLAELEAAVPATPATPAADAPVSDALRDELEPVLGPLRDADPDMRALAIQDARSLSDDALLALGASLRDESLPPNARTGVAEILGARGTPAALEALCVAVESASEPWLRSQCAYQLGRAGPDFLLPRMLLRLKYEKDLGTAFWLADAISRLKHLAGVDGMLVIWSSTQDETLRAEAAARLLELAGEHGLDDAVELVRRWNAGELPPAEPPFVPSERLVLEAWRWIARLGEWNLRTVDDARFALTRSEAWVVPLLCEALHDEEVYVRTHAAQCLERMGRRATAASGELVAALVEPRVAPAAAQALGALGVGAAVAPLEAALEKSLDVDLRVAAAAALGKLARPSSRDALRRAFDGAQEIDMRQAAAQALLAVEDAPDARAFVLGCLDDERADASAAEHSLGEWLARRVAAEGSDATAGAAAAAAALERWRALDPAASDLPNEEDVRARRAKRAAIVRELAR